MCVCVFMCVIANQSTSKEPHVSDLSECVLLLYKAHIKVPVVLRYQDLTFVDSYY